MSSEDADNHDEIKALTHMKVCSASLFPRAFNMNQTTQKYDDKYAEEQRVF